MAEISKDIVQRAISEYDRNLDIESFEKFGSGDARDVFDVETKSGRNLVLYLCTDTNEDYERRFKKEEKLLELVNRETNIPTQEILYSDFSKSQVPYLYYLARKIEGYNPENRFKYLPSGQKKEIVRKVGGYLGELHRQVIFSHSGDMRFEDDELRVNREGWKDYLFEWAYQWIDELENNRFSDIKNEVESFLRDNSELAEQEDYFCCVHWDVSPDNLILQKGEVKAVIDWEKAISGPPEWDVANSRVHMIYRWFESNEISRDLEQKFLRGYTEERELKDNWKKKVLYYEMIQSLRGMANFPEWTEKAGFTEERKKEEEEFFRNLFRKRQNLEAASRNEINF